MKTGKLLYCILFFIIGCSASNPSAQQEKTPRKYDPFFEIGCKSLNDYSLDCSDTRPEGELICDGPTFGAKLSNLEPHTPIIKCSSQYWPPSYDGYDYENGINCNGLGIRYCDFFMVLKDRQIVEVRTKKKFIELFAPVESKEEAAAFVEALTFFFPYSENHPPKGYTQLDRIRNQLTA